MNAPVSYPFAGALAAYTARQRHPSGDFLCTTLARADNDGDACVCDVVIEFDVEADGTRSVTDIWLEPYDAPDLTEVERATLTAWMRERDR